MEMNSHVLDFDWEKDIQTTPIPIPYIYDHRPKDPRRTNGTFLGEPNQLVQADPDDMLVLSHKPMEKTTYHAHTVLWKNTLDHYLYAYYHLTKKKYRNENVLYELSSESLEKFINFIETSADRRKEPLPGLELGTSNRYSSGGNKIISVSRFASSSLINTFLRWLWTPSNASSQESSLFYDGLVFHLEDESTSESNPVPPFTLVDYIEHELMTGISLSIEITSVLLEIDDPVLREAAFSAFVDNALDLAVASPLLFTRNTAARNFIQQIIMESNKQQYEWRENITTPFILTTQWQDAVQRARNHTEILRITPYDDYDTVSQIDSALDQITTLLSQVKSPINLPSYVEKPTHGLAAFCHPDHKNIAYFLNKLGNEDMQQLTRIPRCRKKELQLFMQVHTKVKTAIRHLSS